MFDESISGVPLVNLDIALAVRPATPMEETNPTLSRARRGSSNPFIKGILRGSTTRGGTKNRGSQALMKDTEWERK